MRLFTIMIGNVICNYLDQSSLVMIYSMKLRSFSMLQVREMFYHAFDGYMQHAFPLDELRPLTCTGEDSLGGYALTLVRTMGC